MSSNTKRIKELEEYITKYRNEYYNGSSSIKDELFDALIDELQKLDPTNVLLHNIGKDSINNKVKHIIPMGSLSKLRNDEELKEWITSLDKSILFVIEYKLDGSSIELQYKNGVFTKAVTRGDGIIGDDVTHSVSLMTGVIPSLSIPWSGAIRGEVIMLKEIKDKYFPDAANCRNAANGIMKRHDTEHAHYLHIITYDAINEGVFYTYRSTFKVNKDIKPQFQTEQEKIRFLESNGFTVVNNEIISNESYDNIYQYIKLATSKRDLLPFVIDGIVIKSNDVDNLDVCNPKPKKQVAYKFPLTIATTTLLGVDWNQKGSTFTPVAILKPVIIQGSEVKRANLVNLQTIEQLQIKLGDTVGVSKRGEIIPKIEYVIHSNSSSKSIKPPVKCPSCKIKLTVTPTLVSCPNPECPELIPYMIERWIQVHNIMYIGPVIIRELIEKGLIKSIPDLYKLTVEQLIQAEFGPIMSEKIYRSIDDSRKDITLISLIDGLSIEGIGKTMVEKIVDSGYTTLDSILSITVDDLTSIDGFSNKLGKRLYEGLKKYNHIIFELLSLGIQIDDIDGNPYIKKAPYVFCISGELESMKRTKAIKLITTHKARYSTTVTTETTHIVCNDLGSNSSKIQKARKLNIPIISEQEFLDMLKDNK